MPQTDKQITIPGAAGIAEAIHQSRHSVPATGISSSGLQSMYSFLTSSPWLPLEVEVAGGGREGLQN